MKKKVKSRVKKCYRKNRNDLYVYKNHQKSVTIENFGNDLPCNDLYLSTLAPDLLCAPDL